MLGYILFCIWVIFLVLILGVSILCTITEFKNEEYNDGFKWIVVNIFLTLIIWFVIYTGPSYEESKIYSNNLQLKKELQQYKDSISSIQEEKYLKLEIKHMKDSLNKLKQ